MIIDQERFLILQNLYGLNRNSLTFHNLYGINTSVFFKKYHQIIINILERWKLLLKGKTAVEQGIHQRQTNIDIISLKHNIHKTIYSTQLKDTSQERLKSDVKWTKDFQSYDIV